MRLLRSERVMQQIRRHLLTRFLCGLVAVVILNLSVDAPDLYDNAVPEDLSYNDVESVIEWALEDVLNIENAIPEHDDDDQNNPLKVEKHFELFNEPLHAALVHLLVESPFKPLRNFVDPAFHPQSISDELVEPPDA